MDEKPVAPPGVQTDTYHTLGRKTLLVFVLQRIHGASVLLLLAVGLFVIKDERFVKVTPLGNLGPYVNLAAWSVLALFAGVFFLTFFVTWLIYIHYKFFLGDDALKIKRGIFNKEEIAIPYRQIQNVDIARDLSFQLFGLSRLVILTAGEDEEKSADEKSEGILPALDKDLAEWLQGELLKRANVQKVTETK